MPTTQTFVEQLRQARDATHSKNHPYLTWRGRSDHAVVCPAFRPDRPRQAMRT